MDANDWLEMVWKEEATVNFDILCHYSSYGSPRSERPVSEPRIPPHTVSYRLIPSHDFPNTSNMQDRWLLDSDFDLVIYLPLRNRKGLSNFINLNTAYAHVYYMSVFIRITPLLKDFIVSRLANRFPCLLWNPEFHYPSGPCHGILEHILHYHMLFF